LPSLPELYRLASPDTGLKQEFQIMIIVLAAESKEDFIMHIAMDEGLHQYIWVSNATHFANFEEADAFIDFNADLNDYGAIDKPLLLNQTSTTVDKMVCNQQLTARFCGWAGFADRSAWEIATSPNADIDSIKLLLGAIGKEMILVKDIPGLIAPRIVSTIINEACYAISEDISDAQQIDIAMRLGTNYPEGPISWGKRIGATKVYGLLSMMSVDDSRYAPHDSLLNILS
jgi:3-hydroxybutyryl-CoA dehydrogenase